MRPSTGCSRPGPPSGAWTPPEPSAAEKDERRPSPCHAAGDHPPAAAQGFRLRRGGRACAPYRRSRRQPRLCVAVPDVAARLDPRLRPHRPTPDRQSVVEGKSVSVRVYLGERQIITKKNTEEK